MDGGDCRTAPATPGLLKDYAQVKQSKSSFCLWIFLWIFIVYVSKLQYVQKEFSPLLQNYLVSCVLFYIMSPKVYIKVNVYFHIQNSRRLSILCDYDCDSLGHCTCKIIRNKWSSEKAYILCESSSESK